MKVGLSVFFVILIILICVIAVWCYRRRTRNTNKGLPYEIHIGEQEFDDVDY